MTPTQKQLLRDALVAALVTASPGTLPLSTLQATARAAGFPMGEDETASHLSYIVGKGLAEETEAKLSAGLKRWKATAEGTDYAERNALV